MKECTPKELQFRFCCDMPFANELELRQRMEQPCPRLDEKKLKPGQYSHEEEDLLAEAIKRYNPMFQVLYINEQLDSSLAGRMQVLCCGPNTTFKTPEEAPEWLNDLPSQRQYKRYWCRSKETA